MVTSVISLDRVALRKRVVDAPEILTVIGQIPHLSEFVNALYNCQYKQFFQVSGESWPAACSMLRLALVASSGELAWREVGQLACTRARRAALQPHDAALLTVLPR